MVKTSIVSENSAVEILLMVKVGSDAAHLCNNCNPVMLVGDAVGKTVGGR